MTVIVEIGQALWDAITGAVEAIVHDVVARGIEWLMERIHGLVHGVESWLRGSLVTGSAEAASERAIEAVLQAIDTARAMIERHRERLTPEDALAHFERALAPVTVGA